MWRYCNSRSWGTAGYWYDHTPETIQVGVDNTNDTVNLGQEVSNIINDITNGDATSSVAEETAENWNRCSQRYPITVEVMYDNDIVVTENEKKSGKHNNSGRWNGCRVLWSPILLKAGDEELGNLTQLSEPMTFKVAIPTDLIKEGREYFIIRIHNGLAEKLDTTLNEDGTLFSLQINFLPMR